MNPVINAPAFGYIEDFLLPKEAEVLMACDSWKRGENLKKANVTELHPAIADRMAQAMKELWDVSTAYLYRPLTPREIGWHRDLTTFSGLVMVSDPQTEHERLVEYRPHTGQIYQIWRKQYSLTWWNNNEGLHRRLELTKEATKNHCFIMLEGV